MSWALIPAFYLTSIVAVQAEEECKFDPIHYDIKLLTIAQGNGLDIDSRTSSIFLLGKCKNLALLELAGGEFSVFDLDSEVSKGIRILSQDEVELDLLKGDLGRQEFWEGLLVTLKGQLPIQQDYELRALYHNGVSYLSFVSSLDSIGIVASTSHLTEVPLFVSSRVNEVQFMQHLIELGLEIDGVGSTFEVAGDNGFIFSDASARTFVEYGSLERYEMCDYNEVLDRAKKFPVGVALDNFSADENAERLFFVAIANHLNRSKYTAISFGC